LNSLRGLFCSVQHSNKFFALKTIRYEGVNYESEGNQITGSFSN